MTNNIDFFFVYDRRMKNHLSKQGHRYVTHAISVMNRKRFWLFIRTDDMQTDIDEFVKTKN